MSSIKVAVATNSLGKSAAGHTIQRKLEAAKSHGFDGVEVAIECVNAHAKTLTSIESREARLRAAASDIYTKSSSLSLSLIALNPFGAYDGLKDPRAVEARLKEAELWCELCHIMHIPIFQVLNSLICLGDKAKYYPLIENRIQICTALYPVDESKIDSEPAVIAANMRKLGLLALKYNLRVAYEAPSWGIHKDTWQHVQEILDLVNLPNVGHCLDTFHIASKEAGNPFSPASPIQEGGFQRLQRSLDELKCTVNPANIVYLQLSDATVADLEQKEYPMQDLAQPALMTQSRNCRIYPCEEQYGSTLPVIQVAKTIFDMGYNGWVSMEVFHTDMWNTRAS